ncbi:ribose-phosphate pyrophosphokinase [Weissella koreensis]|uniref:Ribose-phosphate pyrophosphokinase n=1 Tax=Weissella koreensis TaxID=165096 RepID=A0A7H1MMV3_9LACO|nr:ribose-phosphate pyrophosphokinase [Weissella koreensis]AVH75586.1 ribose-phosphate pyrophosphokinase [Weissella koreensis]MCZ9311641.1 ribose-phosphate pyrophosphokinase [Weissella koreensis]QGN20807.1 ribose-phosphate diphosphokinase [Weissella koreensis]QNT64789.1 ribose-phosphate pyrophosphokinase [Weissella koreensis]
MEHELKLIGLSTNHELAQKIADEMGADLMPMTINQFADGEIYERILESVRGADVYILAPISGEVNDSFMEIMIVVDALRRASAHGINVVMPYFGYVRQDRKTKSREPITAKMVSSLLEMNGVQRILAIDLHADQVQGFFDIPVDQLLAAPLLSDYFLERNFTGEDTVVFAPDHNGAGRARQFASILEANWGVINDRAVQEDIKSPNGIVGEVAGKRVIVIDDIIDTGRRMVTSAKAVKYAGAIDVSVVATHGVLSDGAAERLKNCDEISQVVITDTVEVPAEKQFDKLKIITVAPLIAAAINRVRQDKDLSGLLRSRIKPDIKI